jgi:ABC-2 type transport system ATP-binding protein
MINAYNLCKVYTQKEKNSWLKLKKINEKVAIEDMSLQIEPGRIVGLLGVNGAGKTTMIKMLSGLLEPTSGTFNIYGIDGVKNPKQIKKIVNIISGGERNIYWRLTARENLEYFGSLYNVPKRLLESRIKQLISLVGLSQSIDIPVERYSKGMKQRLQIARGLINDPKVIFLDEPTLGLDIAIAKELRSYVRDLAVNQGKSILLTTHYITEVEELCDNVYLIDKGRVIKEGSPKDLVKLAQLGMNISITVSKLTQSCIKDINDLSNKYNAIVELKEVDFETTISITVKENVTTQLLKILTEADILINDFSTAEPRLEDALMKLTTEVG